MRIHMIATRDMKLKAPPSGGTYSTRRLMADDTFTARGELEARLYEAFGARRATLDDRRGSLDKARAKAGMKPVSSDSADIAALRVEYQAKLGKRPFNGWSADQLREKIAAE